MNKDIRMVGLLVAFPALATLMVVCLFCSFAFGGGGEMDVVCR